MRAVFSEHHTVVSRLLYDVARNDEIRELHKNKYKKDIRRSYNTPLLD